jgi:drug/metabolite transporter (DMT)-like permease
MMTRGHWAAYPAAPALISAALFGAATPASKALLGSLTAFQLAGLLYLGAALGVLAVIVRKRTWRPPWRMSRRNRRLLLGAVISGGMFGPVLLLLGLQLASAASVSMLLNLELVATAVLGRLFFHDHLGRKGWIGVAGIVAAGTLLSVGAGMAGVWAGLLIAGACICWGFDNHCTALIDGITPSQSTLWKGLMAGAANLTIGVYLHPFAASASVTAGALTVGVLSYGASITLYIAAAQGMGATRAQMLFASAPFFGVALSAIVLGESISTTQLIAAGVLAASLTALFRDQHHHLHIHATMAHEHSHRHDDGHHTHDHPGLSTSNRHSHWHEHEETEHAHPHWPDLHHRHRHG